MPPQWSALSKQLRGEQASLGKTSPAERGHGAAGGAEAQHTAVTAPNPDKEGRKGRESPSEGERARRGRREAAAPTGRGARGDPGGGAEGPSAAPSSADGRPEVRPREPSPHPAPFLCCRVARQPPTEPRLRTHPLTAPSRPESARLWRSRRPPTRRFPQAGSPASPPPPGASQPRKRPPRASLPRRLGQSKRRGAGERHRRLPMSCEHLGKLTGPRRGEGAGRDWRRLPDGAGSQSGGWMMSWGRGVPGEVEVMRGGYSPLKGQHRFLTWGGSVGFSFWGGFSLACLFVCFPVNV